jgi:hypothetical protein
MLIPLGRLSLNGQIGEIGQVVWPTLLSTAKSGREPFRDSGCTCLGSFPTKASVWIAFEIHEMPRLCIAMGWEWAVTVVAASVC